MVMTTNSLEVPLSLKEAAPYIGKKPETIREDVHRRPHTLLPFFKMGGQVFFMPSEIAAFIERAKGCTASSRKTSSAKAGRTLI